MGVVFNLSSMGKFSSTDGVTRLPVIYVNKIYCLAGGIWVCVYVFCEKDVVDWGKIV